METQKTFTWNEEMLAKATKLGERVRGLPRRDAVLVLGGMLHGSKPLRIVERDVKQEGGKVLVLSGDEWVPHPGQIRGAQDGFRGMLCNLFVDGRAHLSAVVQNAENSAALREHGRQEAHRAFLLDMAHDLVGCTCSQHGAPDPCMVLVRFTKASRG